MVCRSRSSAEVPSSLFGKAGQPLSVGLSLEYEFTHDLEKGAGNSENERQVPYLPLRLIVRISQD